MFKLKLQDKDGNVRVEEVKSSTEYLEEANTKLNHWREIQESITGHNISSSDMMKAIDYVLGFNQKLSDFEASQIETVIGFEEDNNG
jgi:hypothetical protein